MPFASHQRVFLHFLFQIFPNINSAIIISLLLLSESWLSSLRIESEQLSERVLLCVELKPI